MNGAPRIAPTPMSSPAAWPDAIAMIGRSVSGSAVPTAASTEPDRALGQTETLADPFDAVREQLGARQDHQQRDDQQRPIHLAGHAPRAC